MKNLHFELHEIVSAVIRIYNSEDHLSDSGQQSFLEQIARICRDFDDLDKPF